MITVASSRLTLAIIADLGINIIDNFFEDHLNLKIQSLAESSSFNRIFQVRSNHYSHVFYSDNSRVTNTEEPYIASFDVCTSDTTIDFLKSTVLSQIAPALKRIDPQLTHFMIPSLVRLGPSSFYRTHVDSYAGSVGYTIFINDGWMWDYGGILTYLTMDGEHAMPFFPVNNRMLLRDERKRAFHYVSKQTDFSAKYQYLILGWADSSERDSTQLRNYIQF